MEQTKPTLVWKTQEGFDMRISHMSDEHIVNAINWLLVEPGTDDPSDLNDTYLQVPIIIWIRELTQELYRRLHPTGINPVHIDPELPPGLYTVEIKTKGGAAIINGVQNSG